MQEEQEEDIIHIRMISFAPKTGNVVLILCYEWIAFVQLMPNSNGSKYTPLLMSEAFDVSVSLIDRIKELVQQSCRFNIQHICSRLNGTVNSVYICWGEFIVKQLYLTINY